MTMTESGPSKKTVLVVDDEPQIRGLIREVLEAAGFSCLEAEDGYRCLKALRSLRPDVILMDINMPYMDGYEAAARIKGLGATKTIPIIAVTGEGGERQKERCLAAGCDGYLSKPFDPDGLLATIEAAVNGKRERVEDRGLLEEHNRRLAGHLEHQVEELLGARSQLESYANYLRLAAEVTEQTSGGSSVDATVQAFCSQLATHLRAGYCALLLLDGLEMIRLVGRHGPGLPWALHQEIPLQAVPLLKCALKAGEEMVLGRDCPGLRPHEAGLLFPERINSVLLKPLLLNGQVLGLFVLGSPQPGGAVLQHDGRRFCHVLLSQMGMYLENIRLVESTKDAYIDSIYALATALDERDPHTRNHSDKVTQYAMTMTFALGLPMQAQKDIKTASMLHDIGKIGIPDRVLLKTGRLSAEDLASIRSHPTRAARIMRNIAPLRAVIPIVEHHHERWDGGGYCNGLTGTSIPLGARVLSIADSYDAMTSDRPYRARISHEQAMTELRRCAGSQFDADLVELFIETFQQE
ncbi:MAG: HD domain-containing phosphohydrolase [Pseudomonadota bacterium]